jgi:hypothetical protein
MLYEIFITLVAFLFLGLWLYVRNDNKALYKKYNALATDYRASEEGIQEIVDNYENDLLQASENAESLGKLILGQQESIEMRDNIIEHHAKHCHHIIEDTFELIAFRFREEHPQENDFFHEHLFGERCSEKGCPIHNNVDGNHVYFDVTVELPAT